MERNNFAKEDFSKKIPNLFRQNYKSVSYYLDETPNRTYNKRNFIPVYEGKLKVLCYPHINACKIDRYLLWVLFLNMEKTHFVKFGIMSFSSICVLKKKWKDGVAI